MRENFKPNSNSILRILSMKLVQNPFCYLLSVEQAQLGFGI